MKWRRRRRHKANADHRHGSMVGKSEVEYRNRLKTTVREVPLDELTLAVSNNDVKEQSTAGGS